MCYSSLSISLSLSSNSFWFFVSMAFSVAITSPSPLRGLRTSPAINPPSSTRSFPINCNQKTDGLSVDRRGMLIGLGGLYGLASPLTASSATVVPTKPGEFANCHLTMSDKVVDYQFPSLSETPFRVRPAAHLVDDAYVGKYNEALRRMKSLPESHPWNFYTHAKNHEITAHDNYLFLPWHRFYIYFYERILGKLIDDPTFALPFWNFDSPDGMSLPALFLDPNSPLYNPNRDQAHLPPAVLDFWYVYGASTPDSEADRAQRRLENLKELRKAFRQSLAIGTLFMGDPPAAAGDGDLGSAGRIDSIHKAIHQWVGPAEAPWMEMGSIHASTKDPMFYSLHGNMDRLWEIYRRFRGGGPDITDDDYLNATFNFVDDNMQHVHVKVKDCFDTLKMGYTYEEVPNLWAGHNTYKTTTIYVTNNNKPAISVTPVSEFGSETKKLDAPVRILVTRPKARRTSLEKAAEVEVLHLNGVDVVPSGPARFDIYISATAGGGDFAGADYGEFAGSYVKPLRVHSKKEAEEFAISPPQGKRRKGSLALGITPLLEDMGAEDAEKLVVTLVPTDGDISVDGIGIKLVPADRPLLL